ncbi:hypothetical protein C8R46DRAFT_1361884 [Mycena filopes]|nr:hypothetical protein C8R46DRAFT_1361884 [Mycena filopes]
MKDKEARAADLHRLRGVVEDPSLGEGVSAHTSNRKTCPRQHLHLLVYLRTPEEDDTHTPSPDSQADESKKGSGSAGTCAQHIDDERAQSTKRRDKKPVKSHPLPKTPVRTSSPPHASHRRPNGAEGYRPPHRSRTERRDIAPRGRRTGTTAPPPATPRTPPHTRRTPHAAQLTRPHRLRHAAAQASTDALRIFSISARLTTDAPAPSRRGQQPPLTPGYTPTALDAPALRISTTSAPPRTRPSSAGRRSSRRHSPSHTAAHVTSALADAHSPHADTGAHAPPHLPDLRAPQPGHAQRPRPHARLAAHHAPPVQARLPATNGAFSEW